MTEILTARLRLRRAVPEDVVAMHAVMSSPPAMKYWSTPPHQSLAVTEAWFPGALLGAFGHERDEWIVEFEGRVVGYVGMWKRPEFGFILHPDVWGRGFASEAAGAFVEHAFRTLDLEELAADVDPRNEASLKVLKKLGFVETGRAEKTFLLADGWSDSIYLALPRPR